MIRLIEPCKRYLDSYVEARGECVARQIDGYFFGDAHREDVLLKFENYRKGVDLPPGRVAADYYWLVEEESERFIGEICIRHELTEALKRYGGHIGYGVRPSEWNRGYGTRMLNLALQHARERGLSRVLITCDDDNIASARVMEKNGCVLEDKVQNVVDGKAVLTRRYWKDL